VETTATPRAAPTWKAVLLSPDASPDSCSATPESAAIEDVTKTTPIPGPKIRSPRKMSPKSFR
jgi:hypothetical protein